MNQGRNGQPAHEGARRLSVAHFLGALVVLLVTLPFLDEVKYGDLVEAVLITLVLLSAVMAVGGRHRTLIAASVLVIPAVVAKWIDHFRPGLIPKELMFVTAIVFVAFIIVHLLSFILRGPGVNAEVLCAAAAIYLMIAILWAFAYMLVARLVPNSFDFTAKGDAYRSMARFEALYFSLGALTTVNYGDIIPVSNAARMLAMTEAATGVFYLALLVARLVGLYSSTWPAELASGQKPATATEQAGR